MQFVDVEWRSAVWALGRRQTIRRLFQGKLGHPLLTEKGDKCPLISISGQLGIGRCWLNENGYFNEAKSK